MTDIWNELLHGERWRSSAIGWVEDDVEHTWSEVDDLARPIEEAIRADDAVRVAEIRSASKLGAFAGQLAAWRAGCVAVANDGNLGPEETDRVRPDVTVTVEIGGGSPVASVHRAPDRRAPSRIPDEVVAVNFTSGSTGRRRAVGVTAGNLVALFGCRGLDVPADGTLTAGSFATPTFDGWWFDTWRTVATGGRVVCLPGVNDDVFAWPELAARYRIDRVLLPAAVVATITAAVPECVADIPWVFSGGEQFRASTYRQARRAGLTNGFVNLYGPTEATFATHRYTLPDHLATDTIPIGRPLDGCGQIIDDTDGTGTGPRELVVTGPFVCLGYLDDGTVARRFTDRVGEPTYRTGDRVHVDDDGNLVFAGRLDGQLKVNGTRVDTAALEHQVTGLSGVSDCRVAQHGSRTVAFVRVDAAAPADPAVLAGIEIVVKGFSPAIGVELVDHFPVKSGGKVDIGSLMNKYRTTDKSGQS